MVTEVKIKNQSRRMVVDYTPTGNRYTFFQDKFVGVRDDNKDDIEYFKSNDRYEVKGVKTAAKNVAKEVKDKIEGKTKGKGGN